ncbi:hypothetical protein CDD82_947 [Ophiocordyceps australis]|uniref:Homeobox domain-containing protein n=1 Tax=Ophiocordyceps australis TaxID=1399860 RepID=A0A2C5YGU7_9HYPO|nr:hypothetical protein CDD82_947 [Ophiocordyceps australis]
MTTIHEMDELVNWDETRPASAASASHNHHHHHHHSNLALGGALSDTSATARSSASSHFLHQVPDHGIDALYALPPLHQPSADNAAGHMPLPMDGLDLLQSLDSPCFNCVFGGYSCKKMREGRHMGYCTSCVALGLECTSGSTMMATASPIYAAAAAAAASSWPPAAMMPHDASAPSVVAHQEVLAAHGYGHAGSAFAANPSHLDKTPTDSDMAAAMALAPAKIGARFSRESVRTLKNWLTSHNRHPYPTDEEKEALQHQTGLSKTQITNWLANARRRGKVQAPRSASPHLGNLSGTACIDIPQGRSTPALEAMDPLQRWQHSPPEHEPASVAAIARAVTASSSCFLSSSSGLNSPFSLHYTTDDASSRSLCNQSSGSSLATSQSSNGSLGSAYSHASPNSNSLASFGSTPFSVGARRRRRRRATPQLDNHDSTTCTSAPPKAFQCTFCTETFRTKHDWQRHEKSLHLSLERWICAPHGPRALRQENGQLCCIFCGLTNPSDAHLDSHNHTACQERSLEERTFYRKDHLNQHLRLVHNVKFIDWSMKQWKVATPEIRSRCGFCGLVMDTWTIRVDHLADHFKTGSSMADWKGDWGFDMPVLDMVENSISPCTRPLRDQVQAPGA